MTDETHSLHVRRMFWIGAAVAWTVGFAVWVVFA